MARTYSETLTAQQVASLSAQSLKTLADALLFYIDSLKIVPDSGLYGDPEVSLHVVALEMNRRHGAASEQADFFGAAATLADFSQYCDQSDTIAPQATLCAIRAAGCVLDLATAEEWKGLGWAGYTRETLTNFLESYAGAEHRARGYKLPAPRVAVLVPAEADALLPPF